MAPTRLRPAPPTSRGQAGSATTELVLLLPAVLTAILVAVQLALYYHAAQVAEAAAHEGLQAAQAQTGGADAGRRHAQAFLAQAGGAQNPVVAAARDAGGVTVTVHARAPQVLPGLALTVAANASGPVEQFLPEPAR